MKGSIGLLLLLQLVLILLNAVFACAEIAVLSVNEAKLERLASQGNGKAKRLYRLTQQPDRFLSTIQVAITLSGFLGSAFAADNFSDVLVDWLISLGLTIPRATLDTLAVIFITLVLSYFTLIFGELVPKRLAMKKPEKLAMGISGLITFISKLFAPIVWFLSLSTNAVLRLLGIDPNEEDKQLGEEDIRLMVDASLGKGGIDKEEKDFIQNVFEFDDLSAGDIATHRTDVDLLWLEEPMDTWNASIRNTRHSFYPVCDSSPDKVVGVLNEKDYFRLEDKSRESVMAGAVTAPYFVPDTIKADQLFRNMKHSRNSMAIVLDEYGGMVGIVTINDLVEQLVGDLQEGAPVTDEGEPGIKSLPDGSWELRGNIPLEDLEQATGLSFQDEEYDTFTGLVFGALGMIPDDGEQDISLKASGLHIHISRMEDHQIERATIRRLEPSETE